MVPVVSGGRSGADSAADGPSEEQGVPPDSYGAGRMLHLWSSRAQGTFLPPKSWGGGSSYSACKAVLLFKDSLKSSLIHTFFRLFKEALKREALKTSLIYTFFDSLKRL